MLGEEVKGPAADQPCGERAATGQHDRHTVAKKVGDRRVVEAPALDWTADDPVRVGS